MIGKSTIISNKVDKSIVAFTVGAHLEDVENQFKEFAELLIAQRLMNIGDSLLTIIDCNKLIP